MQLPHSQRHPEGGVDDCFACKVRTVSIAPSATPSRNGGAEAAEINAREARWQKDLPAYRNLKRSGVQPKQIDGSAVLEAKAADRFEIEHGMLIPPEQRAEVREGLTIAQEMRDAS